MQGGAGAFWIASLAMTQHYDFQHAVLAWSGVTGEIWRVGRVKSRTFSFCGPAVADISGDGMNEAIYGSGGYMLYAWDGTRTLMAEGWPKFTGHWILGSPAVGDIDGDGYLDVVISTREGWIHAWSTEGHADQTIEWASLHHDPAKPGGSRCRLPRTGGSSGRPRRNPRRKGCNCASAGPGRPWHGLAGA